MSHLIAKEIDDGLTLELAAIPKQFVYTVLEVSRVADVVVVKIDFENSRDRGLDESLEGAAAWWPGPPRGFADVLSVNPELETINLRYVTPEPPAVSEKLFIYPPLFLEALRDWWRNPFNAESALRWFTTAGKDDQVNSGNLLSPPSTFSWLRNAQREAFRLPNCGCAFLHGPPGTGKTTTVGAVLATYLQVFPRNNVLLLSTTNTAVDLALVAVDKALEKLGSSWGLRQKCKRLGHHYQAQHYEGRTHLLPKADPALVKQLAELESKRPESQDIVAYSSWKKQVEQLRAQLKSNLSEVLRTCSLAAMTTCGAMFWTAILHEKAPFDLIVFDEASQVGLAYAIALATFGKRLVFAGDPAQLAPIVQSEHRQARQWLGRSAFDAIEPCKGAFVFLDEQSRMHPEICEVVSRLFYRGRLRVAAKENADFGWQLCRKLNHPRPELRRHVGAITVPASSTWSQKYRGPIRYDSAQSVKDIVATLVQNGEDPKNILVLTPFRAQRTLLRSAIRQVAKGISVSTVHKAQGSERRTVIFDPVDGNSNFLVGDEARRLVNVAFSRAEARLIVMLANADRQNPLFNHPSFNSTDGGTEVTGDNPRRQKGPGPKPLTKAEPIESFIKNPSFPRCLKGLRVKYKDTVGLVTDVSNGRITIEPDSGPMVSYSADFIKAMFAGKSQSAGGKTKSTNLQNQWPEKSCNNCGTPIRLVKTAAGWRPYEIDQFRPHRCY